MKQRSVPPRLVRSTRPMMGTFVTLTAAHADEAYARAACERAFTEMESWCGVASEWRPDSALSLLNAAPADVAVKVPDALFELLLLAREVWAASGGAFDPTWLALKPLWPVREGGSLPSQAAVDAALAFVDFGAVALCESSRTARMAHSRTRVGLGGIAKGAAVDIGCRALREAGLDCFLVNAGGDLAGQSDDGWEVGLHCATTGRTRLCLLRGGALATSGTSEQGFDVAGVRYHHLLDPRTGWPVPHLGSVTVSAASCALADALATACFVLGPTTGRQLLSRFPNCSARWTLLNRAGGETVEDDLPEALGFPLASPFC